MIKKKKEKSTKDVPKEVPTAAASSGGPVSYKVIIATGNEPDAGTDAEVYWFFIGEKGESEKIIPKQSDKNFERGKTDEFVVTAKDVGALKTLRIGHNNKGGGIFKSLGGNSWFLDKVTVEKGKETYLFPCGKWLDDTRDDKKLQRDIPVFDPKTTKRLNYKVSVTTGNEKGAGTDASVKINIYGQKLETGIRSLDSDKNDFEQGNTDTFYIECDDLGPIQKIKVGLEGKKDIFGTSDWQCDSITIEDPKRGTYRFPIGKWFKLDDWKEFNASGAKAGSSVAYTLEVTTGNIKGAGTTAQVHIVIYGKNKVDSGKITLENSSTNFSKGATDIFNIDTIDLGEVVKIDIGHNNSGPGSDWFLQNVTVINEISGTKWYFPCGRWLSSSQDDKKIERTLTTSSEPCTATTYEVVVKTGDLRGSGTDANVFMDIIGAKFTSGRRKLDNMWNNFETGQTDKFNIESIDVGEISKIVIGHDNTGTGPGWFLESVNITNISTKKVWNFVVQRWFATDEDDGLIERDLNPGENDGSGQGLYTVDVITGDRRGAGTDANVFIQVYGKKLSSRKQQLDNAEDNFERTKRDTFPLKCATDLGELTKIRIGHDNSGPGPGWYLEKVIVKDIKSGNETYFLAGRWLAKDEGDGQIEIEIPASKADGKCGVPLTSYKISVLTGDRPGAGTDANVFVCIYGENGDTGDRQLENELNNFERNKTDVFGIQAVDVGPIQKIRIRHDNSGIGAAWFLDKVIISSGAGGTWYFLAGKWLDTDNGLSVEIEATQVDGVPSLPMVVYQIEVLTGDRRGAGTDANVFIEIYGESGKSGRKTLDGPGNNFERNETDIFGVETVDLGKITKIRIGHDNSGFGAAWFLEKVTITSEKTKEKYYFLLGDWLEKDHCEKELPALGEDGQASVPLVKYQIDVTTGDRRGAGTDANVYITVHGANGDSGKHFLDGPGNLFERSQTDTFGIECVDLGQLKKILIGHDNSGFGASWYLDKVVITNLTTNEKSYFLCGKWLATDEDDGSIIREIPAGTEDGKTTVPLITYKISTVTGDRRGAGTDANVYILIYGTSGDSGERRLESSGNNFERSQTDNFGIDCVDLGDLQRATIRHDNSGIGSGWFLDKVIVESGKGERWYFPCGKWLADDEDDRQIARDLIAVKEEPGETYAPMITYEIEVFTGDRSGAGTDANVTIQLFGESGNSLSYPLDNAQDNFERNKKDVFGIQCADLGLLKKINIGHDNSGFGASWFLDKVIITSQKTSQKWFFLIGDWLEGNNNRRDVAALLTDGEASLPLIPYKVSVITGDRRGAGTDANVFVYIYGDKGDSGKRTLDGPGNLFERNQTDEFGFTLVDLGELKKIRIGHDDSGFGSDWFLEKIIISNEKTQQKWFFLCGKWLSKSQEDQLIEREIPASAVDGEASVAPYVSYKISVMTGDRRGAGTDANVYINLYGSEGESGDRQLESSGNNFEKNQTDVFCIQSLNLGEIKRIKIYHDNSGVGPGWFLDKVIVESGRGERWYFPCGKWLADDEEDKLISREIDAQPGDSQTYFPMVTYTVDVFTGDRMGAGTDAVVSIELYGENGKSGVRVIDNDQDNFERNKHDVFGIETSDLGKIQKINIGHDNSGIRASWFLDKVIVTSQKTTEQYFFLLGDWLEGGNSRRELVASDKDGVASLPLVSYKIEVFTGDVRGAGTDANVHLVIYGESSDSGKRILEGPGNLFERGQKNEFGFKLVDLGELKKIRIGHDDSGFGADWLLDKVIISNEKTQQKWFFLSGKWLSKDKEDRLIEREIPAGTEDGKFLSPLVNYKILVSTGDRRGAGTDANVFLTVFGSLGESGERNLEGSGNNFERNQIDRFGIECVDLGDLQRIVIRHDNSGIGASWFLDKVEIVTGKGESYFFLCGQWLSADEGDKQISRELIAVKQDSATYTPLVTYKVEVKTGDRFGAGTDATVSIELIGESGKSGMRVLDHDKGPFGRNTTDVFGVETGYLGKLQRINIGHDNSGLGSSWFLDKVTITCEKTNETFFFLLGDWLEGANSRKEIVAADKDGNPSLPMETYTIETTTGDKRGAGTDANVYIVLYGEFGDSGVKTLDGTGNLFERNKTDTFAFKTVVLGELKKIRIGHDNSGIGAGWFLEKVKVTCAGKEWHFPLSRWLDKNEEDGAIEREIPPGSPDGVPKVPLVSYLVDVLTGDRRGAGTDANVFITVFGKEGDSGKRKLESSGNNFERGQTDNFGFDCVDLGEIQKIIIEHDNSGLGASWFLDKVIIKSGAGDTWYFPCGRWLSDSDDDKQICREINAVKEDVVTYLPYIAYTVEVLTGDRPGAGTDANVSIDIKGEQGRSGMLPLDTSIDNFERATKDVFTIQCPDVGKFMGISIGHDNSGLGADWFLDKVIITNQKSKEVGYFLCGDWLKGANNRRELPVADKDGTTYLSMVTYTISVTTGNCRGAGTDANVFIKIFGEKGESSKEILDGPLSAFEKGCTDVFRVTCIDLGNIKHIRIGHDGKGIGSGWFCQSVKIESPAGTYLFPCSRWFDTEEDDHAIERELYVNGTPGRPLASYRIVVVTGVERGAGTDSNVYISLIGTEGKVDQFRLDNDKDNFETGRIDVFRHECLDLGELKQIIIGHDGKGLGAAWLLDKVFIVNEVTNQRWIFPCKQWLDTKQGKPEKTLVPGSTGSTTFQVKVFTGSARGAGTDANVFIIIQGEKGKTSEIQLKYGDNINLFEDGQCDTFAIDGADVGEVNLLTIRHDNAGFGSDWLLDHVEISDQATGLSWTFACGEWLEKSKGLSKNLKAVKIQ